MELLNKLILITVGTGLFGSHFLKKILNYYKKKKFKVLKVKKNFTYCSDSNIRFLNVKDIQKLVLKYTD